MKIRRGEINLHVSDPEKSARFYHDALGFEVCERGGESWTKVSQGDVTLTLFRAKRGHPPVPPGQVCGMTADLHVDDLDAAMESLAAAGAVIQKTGTWEEGRYAFFADPDGIHWELISP